METRWDVSIRGWFYCLWSIKFVIASFTNADRFHNAEARQRHFLRGAISAEYVPAVPAMVFSVGEGEVVMTSGALV